MRGRRKMTLGGDSPEIGIYVMYDNSTKEKQQ
jgi:hypothetical protein